MWSVLREMLLGRHEVPDRGPIDHVQEDDPDQHVKAVESGEHEEGRAEDAAPHVERGAVQEAVLVGLAAEEERAQEDRHEDRRDHPVLPALLQRDVP